MRGDQHDCRLYYRRDYRRAHRRLVGRCTPRRRPHEANAKPYALMIVALLTFGIFGVMSGMGFDEAGRVAYEHIYWDQASLLLQVGLLDPALLPVSGAEQAKRLLDNTQPANEMIERLRLKAKQR